MTEEPIIYNKLVEQHMEGIMDYRNWDETPTTPNDAISKPQHPSDWTFVVPESDIDIATLNQETLYLSLPKKDIPQLAEDYVKALEAGTTRDWCKCEWIVHPDDAHIQALHCRDCEHSAKAHLTYDYDGQEIIDDPCADCGCKEYKDRRVRKGEESSECPIHTRTGFILGFFLWTYHDKR